MKFGVVPTFTTAPGNYTALFTDCWLVGVNIQRFLCVKIYSVLIEVPKSNFNMVGEELRVLFKSLTFWLLNNSIRTDPYINKYKIIE